MNRLRLAIPSASKNVSRCGKLAICRAQSEDSKGGGGFLTGFLIGGAIFGTLGYVFAPQVLSNLFKKIMRGIGTCEVDKETPHIKC
jgi:hypothetical protein